MGAWPPLRTGIALRWVGRLGLAGLAAVCVGVWILPAVPTLPPPDGRYTVGTEVGNLQGNFAGTGDGAFLDESSRFVNPNQNTRVRGLAAADNTRDYFLSDIPWDGPIAGLRVARVDGEMIVLPTFEQSARADIELVVAASKDAIVMVEGGADEATETENNGRVEGFDDQEDYSEYYQGQTGIVDRQQVEGIESKQQ